jgi:hypothetical protein
MPVTQIIMPLSLSLSLSLIIIITYHFLGEDRTFNYQKLDNEEKKQG